MARTHETLTELFTDIADEIRAKKGDSNPIVADNFPTEIANLPSGGDPSEYFNITPTASELSDTFNWVKEKYIKKVDNLIIPDNITNISELCANSTFAPKIICNNNVTVFDRLYQGCESENIDISYLNVTNATNVSQMFNNCLHLKEIDISEFNFLNISRSSYMANLFAGCSNLEKAIITSKIKSGSSNSLSYWFNKCYSLKTLILLKNDNYCYYSNTLNDCYHMNGTISAIYNPDGLKDGRIYVPDDLVDSYKVASGWSTYADQILPLSEYVEE